MTVAVAVSMAAEHVVETLQEEEHYDASQRREPVEGVEDVGIAPFWQLHSYGLREEKDALGI